MKKLTTQACVFDFDGLIIDTETASLRAWQDIYAGHGAELPMSIWHPVIGTQRSRSTVLAHLETLIGPYDQAALTRSWFDRHIELVNASPVLPGVLDCLDRARDLGVGVAIASSATSDWVLSHLDRLGLRAYFDVVCTGDEHPAKPAPDVYLAALRALDVPAQDAIAFEDSAHGVTAAKAAGLFCVAVPNPVTVALSFDHADMRLSSFTDLVLDDLVATSRPRYADRPRH